MYNQLNPIKFLEQLINEKKLQSYKYSEKEEQEMEKTNLAKNKIHQTWVKQTKYRILKQKREEKFQIFSLSQENKLSNVNINEDSSAYSLIQQIIIKLAPTSYQVLSNFSQDNTLIDHNSDNNLMDIEFTLNQTHFTYVLKGINKETHEQVTINVCKQNQLSYEILKYESTILKQLRYFDSVLQYKDEIDLPEENLFILITDSYEKSLEDLINERKAQLQQTIFTKEELVNLFLQLFQSYAQLHAHKICHYIITPDSIVIDAKGNYKLRNFVSQSKFIEALQRIEEDNNQSILVYLCPETQQMMSEREGLPKKFHMNYQSDVYNLGLIFVQLMGFKIDLNEDRRFITEQNYEEIKRLVNPEFHNLLAFVYNYMLHPQQELRQYFFFLSKTFLESYVGVHFTVSIELDRIERLITVYKDHDIKPNIYLAYLQSRQICLEEVDNDTELQKTLQVIESQENNDMSTMPMLHLEIISCYLLLRNIRMAHKMVVNFHVLFKKVKKQQRMVFYKIKARMYLLNGEYKNSIESYTELQRIIEKYYSNSHLFLVEVLFCLGLSQLRNGDKIAAINNYERALQIAQSNYPTPHLLLVQYLSFIRSYYSMDNNHEKVIEYSLKMLELQQQIYPAGDNNILQAMKALSLFYLDTKQFDKSREYSNQSIEILKTQTSTAAVLQMNYLIGDIGNSYYLEGDKKQALVYMDQVQKNLERKEEMDLIKLREQALRFMAEVYFETGEREKQYLICYEEILLITKWGLEQPHSYSTYAIAFLELEFPSQMKFSKILLRECLTNPKLNKNALFIFISVMERIFKDWQQDQEEQEQLQQQLEILKNKFRKSIGLLFEANYGDLDNLALDVFHSDDDEDDEDSDSDLDSDISLEIEDDPNDEEEQQNSEHSEDWETVEENDEDIDISQQAESNNQEDEDDDLEEGEGENDQNKVIEEEEDEINQS